MRLSDWRSRAPFKESVAPKVIEVIEPILAALGAERDPTCWIAWGDDAASRYAVLAPTAAGLVQMTVRVNVPQEGPRASGKLIRWNRVSVGDLAVEMADRHRLLSFQVEGHVLRDSDADADLIADFALRLFAAIDGRMYTPTVTANSGGRDGGRAAGPIAAGAARTAQAEAAGAARTSKAGAAKAGAAQAESPLELDAPRDGTR